MEFEKVFKNQYGYYELKKRPTAEERQAEFENEYFQNSMSSYEQQYEPAELVFFENKLKQKQYLIEQHAGAGAKRFLDIGCGEGFAISHFDKAGYEVTGMDYSHYGVSKHNPHMADKVIYGDCYRLVADAAREGLKWDIINMDAVLDMVLNPKELIEKCDAILAQEGIFFIKVANNYSDLQIKLINEGKLKRDYWLDETGHPSYFNKDGLIALFDDCGYRCVDFVGDSFIDFNLLNENTNYYENKSVGKSCYRAKVELENMMHEKSVEDTIEVYRLLGKMGYGREIIGIFKRK